MVEDENSSSAAETAQIFFETFWERSQKGRQPTLDAGWQLPNVPWRNQSWGKTMKKNIERC